jgi:hypothetical protein
LTPVFCQVCRQYLERINFAKDLPYAHDAETVVKVDLLSCFVMDHHCCHRWPWVGIAAIAVVVLVISAQADSELSAWDYQHSHSDGC